MYVSLLPLLYLFGPFSFEIWMDDDESDTDREGYPSHSRDHNINLSHIEEETNVLHELSYCPANSRPQETNNMMSYT